MDPETIPGVRAGGAGPFQIGRPGGPFPVLAETEDEYTALLRAAAIEEAVLFSDPSTFSRQLRWAGAGLVCYRPALQDWLARTRWGASDVTVVARLTPISLRRLWPERHRFHLVWWEDLWQACAAPRSPFLASLARAGEVLRARAADNPLVQRAVDVVVRRSPPIARVGGLAQELSVSPGALRYHWKSTLGPIPLKEFLDWAVLMRALDDLAGRGRAGVARRLGIHCRTLERLAVRLAGVTLSELAKDHREVADSFRAWTDPYLEPGRGRSGAA